MNLFFYLIFTIILEFIVYIITIRKKTILLLIYCFLINLFSWPLANLFYGIYGLFWAIEIGVFITESVLVKYLLNISWKKAIIVSFIANLITIIFGLIIF